MGVILRRLFLFQGPYNTPYVSLTSKFPLLPSPLSSPSPPPNSVNEQFCKRRDTSQPQLGVCCQRTTNGQNSLWAEEGERPTPKLKEAVKESNGTCGSVGVHTCVCVWVGVGVCEFVCVRVYVCVHTWVCVCVYMRARVCACVRMCMCE